MSLHKRPQQTSRSRFNATEAIAHALRENPNLSYLLDGVGIVSQEIHADEPGRVKYQHSYWNAIAWDGIPLLPGTRVRVVGVNNITLIVYPVGSTGAQTPAFGLV